MDHVFNFHIVIFIIFKKFKNVNNRKNIRKKMQRND